MQLSHQPRPSMKSFPVPVLAAAAAGLVALPFHAAAAGTLLFTASLGIIIHADYVQRHRRVRLPKLAATAPVTAAAPLTVATTEQHPLAA